MLSPLFFQHAHFSVGSFPNFCTVRSTGGWNDVEFTRQSYTEIQVTREHQRFELHSPLRHGVLSINTYGILNL